MHNKNIGAEEAHVKSEPSESPFERGAVGALRSDTGDQGTAAVIQALQPWRGLRVAVIDDALHPPQLRLLSEGDAVAIRELVMTDPTVTGELRELGCDLGASPDERLRILAENDTPTESVARIGELSPDAQRMFDEHRSFRRLIASFRQEVEEVMPCDPFVRIPDLTKFDLVLLDYYLKGPANGGDLAIELASSIREQEGRPEDQQIVLMSSLESVRELRGEFRAKANVTGSTFAFVGKSDLNETWKVKAHLGMLERARPFAPVFGQYRTNLDDALKSAREGLLSLVDDLDIGDYAFLQGHALMKDGHPLGDYVFWLLSSQLMALAFEGDEMRGHQRALDKLEFVGEPFAATEPSTVVANLLHSALVSRNIGPLGPHPRAEPDGKYAAFPLVQLGDVFFNAARTKAVVVMSADCDLAFSPISDREPNAEMPVMLVPGTPIKLRDAKSMDKGESGAKTDGILHREEVYRIFWEFANYRSVQLGSLEAWLKSQEYDVTNRDRLRPLFALKLQQEFGAHLLRVGPPIMPPITMPATGRVFVCGSERNEVRQLELMLTRFFDGNTLLRVTPTVGSALKDACHDLLGGLKLQTEAEKGKKREHLDKKIESLSAQLENDDFWIDLLKGLMLNAPGRVKDLGPLRFVHGSEWSDSPKPCVVLAIEDAAAPSEGATGDGPAPTESSHQVGAVSGAA
jgi:hypothetical protein